MGKEQFDTVTKIFLEKYKDTPVNMEEFCSEYIALGEKGELKDFFKRWIYNIEGPKSMNDLNNIQV